MEPISNSPTLFQITTLEQAFNLLNKRFFEGKLQPVMITQQSKKSDGYFTAYKWKEKDGNMNVHEINLTPSTMNRSDKEIIATLLRILVDMWQHGFGNASSTGYHNKQWAEKMLDVGLQPIATANPDKMTGKKIMHRIIEEGPFDRLFNESVIHIRYYSLLNGEGKGKKNKPKYTCPACSVNVWGKPGMKIICGDCNKLLIEEIE